MNWLRPGLTWLALAAAVAVPIAAAVQSPLLASRDPVYIAACFAGIGAMAVMLMQPLLVAGYLPGLRALRGRRIHLSMGILLVGLIALHVGGLWITSPPDMIDALLLASPTPFSVWGVFAMWALLAAAALGILHRRLRLNPRRWRLGHICFAVAAVAGSLLHAIQIEGIMETMSKLALCALVLVATAMAIAKIRARGFRTRRTA